MAEYTKEELSARLKEQIPDEEKAFNEYKNLSEYAHRLGLHHMADVLDSISSDEHRHRATLQGMVDTLPSESVTRHPQTVFEWQSLADAIIRASPSTHDTVEEAMVEIRVNSTYAEGSRRILLNLASSLGV